MKNYGPAQFPSQYPRNSIAITVDFLVKPAMLLAARDSSSGSTGAIVFVSQRPARRVSLSLVGTNLIINVPAMPIVNITIIVMI